MKVNAFCARALEKSILLEKFGDTPFSNYGNGNDEPFANVEKFDESFYISSERMPTAKDSQVSSCELNVNGNEDTPKNEKLKSKKRKLYRI